MKKTTFVIHVVAMLFLAAGCAVTPVLERAETGAVEGVPFMGIRYKEVGPIRGVANLPEVRGGILVTHVLPGGPASEAGIIKGDVIVGMDGSFFKSRKENIKEEFREALESHKPGDKMAVTAARMDPEKKRPGVVSIEMTLGAKHRTSFPPAPDIMASDLGRELRALKENSTIFSEQTIEKHIERRGMSDPYKDLRDRLQKIEGASDGFRLPAVAAVHRDPFLLEPLGRYLTDAIIHNEDRFLHALFMEPEIPLFFRSEFRDAESAAFPPISPDSNQGAFAAWFTDCLRDMIDVLKEVYAPLNSEDRDFLNARWMELGDLFVRSRENDNFERYENDARLAALGRKVDFARLFHAARTITRFIVQAEPMIFEWMEAHPDVRIIHTPWGALGLGSKQYDRWDDPDVKFIFDPGGADFYADGAATADSFERPISWIVDLDGDDAYQATSSPGQGSGVFGVGVLVDRAGDDAYIGRRWAQGAGFMGVGILVDQRGDDSYTAVDFSQGAGLFGYGVVADVAGDDHWRASLCSQGVGMPLGIGLLVDYAGDDRGFCTGKKPSSYGTPGVFEGWAQGVGVGPRELASGGVGVLVDAEGDDTWEAGNFSQGGGYYYGLGIFRSAGAGNDRYIGSRYAQGFSAHQAAGIFMEDGGDDRYTTRNGVASGLAWDQSVSVFIDEGGDDSYFGGMGFSIGASAHNSICLFTDMGGRDEYRHAEPGKAGAGEHHGGSSFSFFNDVGREIDLYTDEKVKNNAEIIRPGFGIFRDGME